MSNFSFSDSVFKRLVSQKHQKVSLCGKWVKIDLDLYAIRRILLHDTDNQHGDVMRLVIKIEMLCSGQGLFKHWTFNFYLDLGHIKMNFSHDTSACLGVQVCKDFFLNSLIKVEVTL